MTEEFANLLAPEGDETAADEPRRLRTELSRVRAQLHRYERLVDRLPAFLPGGADELARAHAADEPQEVERRRLLLRDLQVAHRIQQGLLPESHPLLRNFDLLAWNQPALQTGGDYYDWFKLPDGRMAIVIADAVGHGVGAALMVAAFRAYVRAILAGGGDFASMLARLNNLLVYDFQDGSFITAAIALLDADHRKLQLYSAGQAPLFHYRGASGVLARWAADDIPLGLFPKTAPVHPRLVPFAVGDVLLICTDGFFEWKNRDDEEFGIDRLAAVLEHNIELPLHDLIAGIHGDVLEFADGAEQADDLTALVLRCTG